MQSEKKNVIVKYKILYTALILLIYMLGRNIPLFGVDIAVYTGFEIDAEELLMQSIGGDSFQRSVFALGISPGMLASLLVMIITSVRKSESKARVSPKKNNRLTLFLTLIIAVIQTFMRLQTLQFRDMGIVLQATMAIAALEMVTGAFFITWLISQNKKYGIGGQTGLILVNLVTGVFRTLVYHWGERLLVPGIIAIFVFLVVMIMENTEKRIPIQRISIHNIYADKNYMAIKLNPIGVMPAMFSTAFFMVPQFLMRVLVSFFPENERLLWCLDNLTLSRPLGIVVYLLILYGLTIGFTRVFINPQETTEQLLKSGDSIVDFHAGAETRRYLSSVIGRISFISASVMSLCLGIPLFLQVTGDVDPELAMFPTLVMMLTGVCCNLYREYTAIRSLEEYRPFI